MTEINTKQIVQKWKEELKLEVDRLKGKGIFPKLTIVQDSQTQEECAMYRRNKHRVAEELGVEIENIIINTEGKSKEEIITLLKRELTLTKNPVIVQMPFTNITSTDLATMVTVVLIEIEIHHTLVGISLTNGQITTTVGGVSTHYLRFTKKTLTLMNILMVKMVL